MVSPFCRNIIVLTFTFEILLKTNLIFAIKIELEGKCLSYNMCFPCVKAFLSISDISFDTLTLTSYFDLILKKKKILYQLFYQRFKKLGRDYKSCEADRTRSASQQIMEDGCPEKLKLFRIQLLSNFNVKHQYCMGNYQYESKSSFTCLVWINGNYLAEYMWIDMCSCHKIIQLLHSRVFLSTHPFVHDDERMLWEPEF